MSCSPHPYRWSTRAALALVPLLLLTSACSDSPLDPAGDASDVAGLVAPPSYAFIGGGAWSGTGPGSVTANDGASGDPSLTYALHGWSGTWSLRSTATRSGSLELKYHYQGFHSWCGATVFIRAFVIRNGNTTTSPLAYYHDNCSYQYPSGGFNENGTYTFNLQAGDVYGFEFGGSHGDSNYYLGGTFTVSPKVTVFTSGSNVQTWDPIFPAQAYSNWPAQACTTSPAVGPDANWQNPHNAFVLSGHPWAGSYFQAPWINSWSNLSSRGPGGQSWTKYTTTISGDGDFVLQLLADNCSWIYVDDALVGVQGTDLSKNTYPVSLSGQHTLSFIIFDGGGAAGGKFRIETYQSYVDNGGDPGDIQPPPVVDDTPPSITPVVTGTKSGDWYTSDVHVSWTVTDPESAITGTTGCGDASVTADTQGATFTCSATSEGGTASQSVTVKRDATAPVIAFAGNAGSYTVDQSVAITCSASDATSGVASSTCPGAAGDAYTFALGATTLSASALDHAGNQGTATTEFTVAATSGSVCSLVQRWVSKAGVANSMCQQLANHAYGAFVNHVQAQSGKSVAADKAEILIRLAGRL